MIFGPSSNVKIAFRMTKCDIRPELNYKIGIRMSKQDLEYKNAIYNENMPMQYSAIFHSCRNGNFADEKLGIFS